MRNLIEHLDGEIEVYRELIEGLHRETEDLVKRDYKALYDTIAVKERLLIRIDAMGARRRALLEEAASSLGISGEINISRILERLSGEEFEALKERQRFVIALVDGIKEITKVNSLVVKGSLDNIRKTLGLLGNLNAAGTYGKEGGFNGIGVKGRHLSEGA